MRFSLLVLALVSLSGMLVAAENLYANPKYAREKVIDKQIKVTHRHKHNTKRSKDSARQSKRLTIASHWYTGNLCHDGNFNGAPVIKIVPVKASWGYGGSIASILDDQQKLPPGKYIFSVWCKVDVKPSSIYIYFSNIPSGQEKQVRKLTKSYRNKELPPDGEWTELVMDFEVKSGETRNTICYGVSLSNTIGSLPIWFANPKVVRVEEE